MAWACAEKRELGEEVLGFRFGPRKARRRFKELSLEAEMRGRGEGHKCTRFKVGRVGREGGREVKCCYHLKAWSKFEAENAPFSC